jgi:GPH family glycoside/pentoside/hexuronide:cation symporter
MYTRLVRLFLVLYVGCGVLFLPLWIKAAQRIGKKAAWLSAMALNTGAFLFVFFIGAGDETAYAVLVFLSGIGFGATLALPSAMQADVIDYHELLTGARSEGCYVGLWSVSKKLAAALGIGIALFALGRTGYVPNQPQTQTVRLALRIMYALVPCLCNLAGFAIALRYPISADMHTRIRTAIEEKQAGREPTDPLGAGPSQPG